MKLTASDLLSLGIADEIIPEPEGGAHTDPEAVYAALDRALSTHLARLFKLRDCAEHRYRKFRAMGNFTGKESL